MMDCIDDLWDRLCCGNRRSEDAAHITKKYLLCHRPIYEPVVCADDNLPPQSDYYPFFAYGGRVEFIIQNSSRLILYGDEKFDYEFESDKTRKKSHAREIRAEDYICCCCKIPYDDYCNERPQIHTEVPLEEGDNPFKLATKKAEEIRSRQLISTYFFNLWGQHQKWSVTKIMEMVTANLKEEPIQIPYLIAWIREGNYEPFVDLISFEHLSLRCDRSPVTVTEKMLNCGFLAVNAEITNLEALDGFGGFGLIIGAMKMNNLSFKRLFDEIEKWKNNIASQYQCFGLMDVLDDFRASDEIIEKLKSYSPSSEFFIANSTDIIELDEKDDAAIIMNSREGVWFVRGGWRRWVHVFNLLF